MALRFEDHVFHSTQTKELYVHLIQSRMRTVMAKRAPSETSGTGIAESGNVSAPNVESERARFLSLVLNINDYEPNFTNLHIVGKVQKDSSKAR